MKIKRCCDDIIFYANKSYIECDEESYDVDTPVYINTSNEDDKMIIDYCPFCGKKIKLEK